jgi:hypothetical protein
MCDDDRDNSGSASPYKVQEHLTGKLQERQEYIIEQDERHVVGPSHRAEIDLDFFTDENKRRPTEEDERSVELDCQWRRLIQDIIQEASALAREPTVSKKPWKRAMCRREEGRVCRVKRHKRMAGDRRSYVPSWFYRSG